ncbi:MAG TPA: serine hydrolase domain-containing protein [Steroidobacteraceae bacterium]|jgi:CubicO group peptidase (beta-lactamase class C family)
MKTSQAIDAAIDGALADKRIAGTVVQVAQGGKIVFRRAAGYANREAKVPMAEDALFRLASLSKPLVSAAAMALIEQRKLGLDDTLERWLHPTGIAHRRDWGSITVRQLLTHTSGLGYRMSMPPDSPYEAAAISDGLDESPITLDENVRRIASVPLLFPPGTSWNYSLSIDVLGAVLERVAGAGLAEVFDREIARPLGMTDTTFHCRHPARLTVPYVDGRPEPVLMSDPDEVSFQGSTIRFSPSRALNSRAYPSGGCGMVGTADDFMRLLLALLNGGRPILKPETVAAMMSNQIGTLQTFRGPGFGFGFGGAVITDSEAAQTPQSVGTLSWGGVYGHSWFVDARKEVAVLCMTNTAFEGMTGLLTTQLRDAVYGATA